MKINIFSYGFWPEKFLVNSLSLFLAKKHSIRVSTGMPNYPEGNIFKDYSFCSPLSENYRDVEVLRYPIFPRKKGFLFLFLNYLSNLVFGIINILRLPRSDCNFVFATSPIFTAIPAIIHSKIYRGKTVIWLQDLWPESFLAITGFRKGSLPDKFLGFIVKWIYKHTDLMLVQSDGFISNLEEYGYKGRVEWVPNWAVDEKFNNSPMWLDELPKDKFIVTFAGNIGKGQNLDCLLDAASKLEKYDNIFFAIVGDGREKECLEKNYSHLKNVKFYGRKPVEDMLALFNASSALLVILKKDPAFSVVIPSKFQSYLIASKPIITSLDGAGADMARKYSLGPVVPPESVENLVTAILDLSNLDFSKRSEFGENAYKLYQEKFKIEQVQLRIEQLLLEISK